MLNIMVYKRTKRLMLTGLCVLIIAMVGCGPWEVYHAYNGKTRSVEDVAIVWVEAPICLVAVNNQEKYIHIRDAVKPKPIYDCGRREELHLPAGESSITTFYYDYDRHYLEDYGTPLTKTFTFKAGHLYRLSYDVNSDIDHDFFSWDYGLDDQGNTQEVMCDQFLDIVQVRRRNGCKYDSIPDHWQNFVGAHCPDKLNQ